MGEVRCFRRQSAAQSPRSFAAQVGASPEFTAGQALSCGLPLRQRGSWMCPGNGREIQQKRGISSRMRRLVEAQTHASLVDATQRQALEKALQYAGCDWCTIRRPRREKVMKSTLQCPKCNSTRIGYLNRVEGESASDPDRKVGRRREDVGWLGDGYRPVGDLEGYVCTDCGYFEEYVRNPRSVPWDTLQGFRWCRPELLSIPPPPPR